MPRAKPLQTKVNVTISKTSHQYIRTSKTRHIRHQVEKKINPTGKTRKYLAEVAIPFLRERLRAKTWENGVLRRRCNEIGKKANAIVREKKKILVREHTLHVRQLHKEFNTHVNERVEEAVQIRLHDRLDNMLLDEVDFISGAFMFPIIMAIAKEEELSPAGMSVLLHCNIFGRVTLNDLNKLGSGTEYVKRFILERMVEEEWLEVFLVKKAHYYVPSLKAQRLVKSIKDRYIEIVKTKMRSYEYKKRAFSFNKK